MNSWSIDCYSLEETETLGIQLGRELVPGMVIGCNGTLGSGKTRLIQGICAGQGVPSADVVSPTFTICVPHQGRLRLLHLDIYRINELEEIDELGLDEEVENGAVLFVEWAERATGSLPPLDLQIDAEPIDETTRRYIFMARSDRGTTLLTTLKEAYLAD